MALTRVAPAGIGSTPGTGYVIGNSFLHSRGLNSIDANYTGIVTTQNLRVIGDLEVEGTTTTLDTALTEVDKLEVGANNNTVGVAITQSGTGDILNLYDGGTEVFSVTDGGKVKIGTETEGQVNADNLTIADNNNCGITIRSGNTSGGAIYFSDGTSGGAEYDGYIEYSQNSRYMRFGTATQERLRITSDGNIGIGTDNPTTALEIRTTTTNAATHYRNNASNGGAYFGVRAADLGAASAGEAYVYSYNSGINLLADGNGDINFATGGTASRVRIKDNGNTGIGTDNPVALLNPHGTAALTNTDQVVLISDSNADDAIGRGGNLGFAGYVNGNLRTLAGIGGIKRNAGNSFNGDLAFYTRVNGQPNLYERLRITSDGLVDISGGVQISENITPASGAGLELLEKETEEDKFKHMIETIILRFLSF